MSGWQPDIMLWLQADFSLFLFSTFVEKPLIHLQLRISRILLMVRRSGVLWRVGDSASVPGFPFDLLLSDGWKC